MSRSRAVVLLPLLLLALHAGVAVAAPGDTTRVSVNDLGVQGDSASYGASISADGRLVAFRSGAKNFPGGEVNNAVYLRDREAGTTVLISLPNSLNVGLPAISANGRVVAWTAGDTGECNCSNIINDTNSWDDVLAYDRVTGETEIVSAAPDERQPDYPEFHFLQSNGPSQRPSLSGDGRYVAFASEATSLTAGGADSFLDVYVRDRLNRTTELVSVDSDDGPANSGSNAPSISADGRTVAFVSAASDLVAGDGNGVNDVFVRDLDAATTERVSVSTDGTEAIAATSRPSISADGSSVAYQSPDTNLVSADNNTYEDVFLRDRDAATTTRVSVDNAGAQRKYGGEQASVSATGRVVAFHGIADLPGGGFARDVYTRDVIAGTTTKESLGLGGAQAGGINQAPAISADASVVAFESTGDNLVEDDTNSFVDVFVHERTDPAQVTALFDSYALDQDEPLTVTAPGVLANDAGPGPLSAGKVTNPAHGAVTLNTDGSFTYTPSAGYSGEDSFTYRATPGGNIATVSLHVFRTDLTVTNTDEVGAGSLRWAIANANVHPGADAIDFDIPGSGVQSITLATRGLPAVTEAVTIDGFTQTGASPNTNGVAAGSNAVLRIELTGAKAGFTFDTDDVTLRGVVVNRSSPGAPGNPGAAGSAADVLGDRNVIEGSYLGTNATGTAAAAADQDDKYFTYGVTLYPPSADTRIGGSAPAARTVISGNNTGIWSRTLGEEISVADTIIQGTYLGTDAAGLAVPPGVREQQAVRLMDQSSATIGGAAAGAGNVMSGIGSNTVISLEGFSRATVQGNLIGTQRDGVTALPNGGIAMRIGGDGSIIGGSAPGAGNVIANNGYGIHVQAAFGPGPGGKRNRISGNSIHDNAGIGIDLGLQFGVDDNDAAGDADSGANELQNYPVLSATSVSAGNVTVSGTLPSLFSTTFRVEFFSNPSCDPQGVGEGKTYLGFADVTTDAAGHATFGPLVFPVPDGEKVITATATDPVGNTSEFSACLLGPVANADSYSVAHDTTLDVPDGAGDLLANDSDPAGGTLTAVKSSDPAHGTVTVNANGSFTYTPVAAFSGTDTFTYSADNGTQSSSPGTVTITVTPPEATPTPSPEPTASASPEPTASASPEPTASASPEPTASASPEPTASASPEPTASTSPAPSSSPSPAPGATPTPAPTPTPGGAVGPDELPGPEAQLSCASNRIQLIDVVKKGKRARLLGVAARSLVGSEVVVTGGWNGKVAGRTRVGDDLTFSVLVPLPPKSLRKGSRGRYTAVAGGEKSPALKFYRRLTVTELAKRGDQVIFAGQVVKPLARKRADRRIELRQLVGCGGGTRTVATTTPNRKGRFRFAVAVPASRSATYRAFTKVRSGRATSQASTLPRAVTLR